ncbi:SigE family RNA polymerase sigma factor [Flindersiella endophytica]
MSSSVSFEEFVASRAQALLRYGYVLTGNPHDAADLMQEALLKLRNVWARVAQEAPEAYARTTMARLHISVWRRRRRERLVSAVPDHAAPDDSLTRVESEQGLWRLLETLPRRQRAVLVLRYYESLSDDEIADVLGISRGTVRSQASRALEKLRGAWSTTNEPVPADIAVKGKTL